MTRRNLETNINIFENERKVRNGTCTIHSLVIDPRNMDLSVAVNSLGNNYNWADSTVRGLVSYEEWMKEYFEETAKIFRRKSVKDYAKESQEVVVVTEANGNLFWNLGNFVFSKGNLFKHYREKICRKHAALIHKSSGSYEINSIDFDKKNPFNEIDYAVSGIPIITAGEKSEFFKPHPLTGSILIAEFFGDLSQLLNTAMCVPVNNHLFYSLSQIEPEEVSLGKMSSLSKRVFEKDMKNKLSRFEGQNCQVLYSAMNGEPIRVKINGFEPELIEKRLKQFGYTKSPRLEYIGTYKIDNKFLNIRLLRSTFGHGLTSICEDGRILLTKVYTDDSRKGGYVEDMADIAVEEASQLGLTIKDTLITSNGGDLRVYMPNSKIGFISHSASGMPLSYKGGEDYGITSSFLINSKSNNET